MSIDNTILDYIQSYIRCDFLDVIMPFITRLGDGGILWIAGSLILLIYPKTRKVGFAALLGLAFEVLCCNFIIKPFVARPRPCDVNTTIQLLISKPTDFSFPSGHTGASFAAVSSLYFSKNRLWIPSLILAVLIGFSRLYLYVHYPSDVLAGALTGIMTGWLGYALAGFLGSKHRTASANKL